MVCKVCDRAVLSRERIAVPLFGHFCPPLKFAVHGKLEALGTNSLRGAQDGRLRGTKAS